MNHLTIRSGQMSETGKEDLLGQLRDAASELGKAKRALANTPKSNVVGAPGANKRQLAEAAFDEFRRRTRSLTRDADDMDCIDEAEVCEVTGFSSDELRKFRDDVVS
jgi:hypothetical protein